jgi:glycerophosphoryl diester phosphodiesterase
MTRHRILNIAHMGRVNESSPPNTLFAFKEAVKVGVDGIEFDIQETKDHQYILYHDYELPIGSVKELTLSEIQKIKTGSKSKIPPRLEDAIALCKNVVKLMIEIKHIWSIEKFLRVLKENANLDEIMITSFFHPIIKGISMCDDRLDIGITTSCYLVDPVYAIRSANAKFIVNKYPLVDKKFVSEIHKNNLFVYIWNAKEEKDLKQIIALGVDGIVSDNPILLKSLLSPPAL